MKQYFFLIAVGDILLAYDSQKYQNITFFPVVEACTISKLYDGSNYTDSELLQAEAYINKINAEEEVCLSWIHNEQAAYDTKEFHPYLWQGLSYLYRQHYDSAHTEFIRVIQSGYDHWRIWYYVAQAALKSGKIPDAHNALAIVMTKNSNFYPAKALLTNQKQ